MTAHAVAVAQTGGRYPFRPTCSCGWSTWGYLTNEAANSVADDHKEVCMKCKQELCPAWTGDGCACAVMGVDLDTCPLCSKPVHDYRCGAWPA